MILQETDAFSVSLWMQLEGVQVDEETQQAIEDWHYWVDQATWFIRSKTSISVMALSLTSPTYNV